MSTTTMLSTNKTLKIDMDLILSEVNKVVSLHIHNAVMEFNVSRIQEDISKCNDKIHQLQEDLICLTKEEKIARSRIQETTYRINVSLLEQELISYREKLNDMQEELVQLQGDNSDEKSIYDTTESKDSKNNIVLRINELSHEVLDNKDVKILNIPDVSIVSGNNMSKTTNDNHIIGDDSISELIVEEEEEEEDVDEDEEGVFEIEVNGVSYFTTDEKNGSLYSIDVNGDPDVYVGTLQNGKAVLTSSE